MQIQRRFLVIPISLVVITSLVTYKLTRTYPDKRLNGHTAVAKRPAPLFESLDAFNKLVKLEGYVGRHSIVLVFFNGIAGADRDLILQQIRDDYARFKAMDYIVLGISTALPQENRKIYSRSGQFPFALLSDPTLQIHRQWGLFDVDAGTVGQGVFLIDRAGLVAWSETGPLQLNKPSETLRKICDGS